MIADAFRISLKDGVLFRCCGQVITLPLEQADVLDTELQHEYFQLEAMLNVTGASTRSAASAEACVDDKTKALIIEQCWRRCPGCGILIEKKGGCNQVVCEVPQCGKKFCYICGGSGSGCGHEWLEI